MQKLKSLIIALSLWICSSQSIHSIDPISALLASTAGIAVKEAGTAAKNYWFHSQEEDKRVLKMLLNSHSHQSIVAQGCNEHFVDDCHLFAENLRKAIEYNIASYQEICIKHQQNNQEEYNESKQRKPSYFESLSHEEKTELLKIQRNLAIQYCNPLDYQQELDCMHNAVDTQY